MLHTHLIELSFEYIDRTTRFIQNVFNYYNGKINKFNNNARLSIDWTTNQSRDVMGSNKLPDIVYIYPQVILDFIVSDAPLSEITDPQIRDTFCGYIIETIIHELYHIDQEIDCVRYMADLMYHAHIESATEAMTHIYILNNWYDIFNRFGIRMDTEYHKYNIQLSDQTIYWYNRLNIKSHIANLINGVITAPIDLSDPFSPQYMLFHFDGVHKPVIYEYLDNIDIDIIFQFNKDAPFYLRQNQKYNSIHNINEYFFNNYFVCDLHTQSEFIDFNRNYIKFTVDHKSFNRLICHTTKEGY